MDPNDFTIDVAPDGRRAVVVGELDASVADTCRDQLVRAMRSDPGAWAFDLRGVGFMDSAGVSVLVSVHRAAEGQPVELIASPAVLRVLDMAGIGSLFTVIEER